MATSERGPKRPFWMHQFVEYILGGLLVAQGLQSLTPVMPSLAGGLIMVNAAIVRGPLAAFRVVTRAQHRVLDVAVIVTVAVLAAQPFWEVDPGARLVMIGIALVMAFVWWQTSFVDKQRRTRSKITAGDGRGVEVGRLAGRAMGDGINAAKRLRDSRKSP